MLSHPFLLRQRFWQALLHFREEACQGTHCCFLAEDTPAFMDLELMNEKGLTFSAGFSCTDAIVCVGYCNLQNGLPKASEDNRDQLTCTLVMFSEGLCCFSPCTERLQNFVVCSGTNLTWMCSETILAWTMPTCGMNSQCIGCSLYCVGGSEGSCCGRTEAQISGFSPQHKTLVKSIFCNWCPCWKM